MSRKNVVGQKLGGRAKAYVHGKSKNFMTKAKTSRQSKNLGKSKKPQENPMVKVKGMTVVGSSSFELLV